MGAPFTAYAVTHAWCVFWSRCK